MRIISLRTVAGRALALLGTLTALAAAPALADDAAAPDTDRIFGLQLEAGYHAYDDDANLSRLLPYSPVGDGLILGLDLIYLTPGFGTLSLSGGYLDDDTWRAEAAFNHGADVRVQAGTQAFTHAREHIGTIPTLTGTVKDVGADADPDAVYRDDLQESNAAVKVRIPGYPAHLSASGRVYTRQGDVQERYFFRSCSTSTCHQNSRTRELDQETREYTLGLDTHAGPIDLAYSHTAQTFRDDAPDPVDSIGDIRGGLPAGDYTHDVNPDQRSFRDKLTLNTNLTNRVVLALAYAGGEQENESAGITRRTRTGGATLSWRLTPSALLVGRYDYDEERTGDLSAESRALREANNVAEAELNHQHVVEPERTRHTGELAARFSPIAKAEVGVRVRYRALTRHSILKKEEETFADETGTAESTLAALDGRYRVSPALAFAASVGQEWTENPAYAVETTSATRYELSGTWTPRPVFLFQASWQGFRGKNDDADALKFAYAADPVDWVDPERTVNGDAFLVLASFIPSPAFSLTATWNLTDNGIDQDMVFGSPDAPEFSFLSPDTAWGGRYQVADLRARWAATRRLTLTAEGAWVESIESYAPDFAEDQGLEEISTVEFTKLVGSLGAEIRVTDALGVTLAAFWARDDDQVDDAGDESTEGLLATVAYRW